MAVAGGGEALGDGAGLDRRRLELARVARAKQRQALAGLGGELIGGEQPGVVPPAEDPGDELAAGGVLGLVDRAPRLADAVGGSRLPQRSVGAEVALDQPGDPLADEDRGGPLDLAHLPVGAGGVVAAVEVLRRGEVVLGLRGVGDLAPDAREPEDADRLALVRVADQIELPVAEDEVVGVDLAIGDVVALHRVVAELDRLAAGDRGLDLRQSHRELATARRGLELDVDRGGVALGERARPPPRNLLERETQRLRIGELAVEQAERGPQRGELLVGELDLGEVVVLGRKRVELRLEEPLGRLLHLQRDPEALELGPIGVEAPGEGVLVHRAVALDLLLDLERRDGTPVGHEERDQRELADQLLGVLGHQTLNVSARLRTLAPRHTLPLWCRALTSAE